MVEVFDREERINCLLYVYGHATEDERHAGRMWYSNAREVIRELSVTRQEDFEIVAGVMAALSVQTRWNQNVAGTIRLLRSYQRGDDSPPRNVTLYYKSAVKAWAILKGDIAPGDAFRTDTKTRAFWRNLIGDESAVTVDTWMMRAMDPNDPLILKGLHPAKYRQYAAIVREAARRVGETPAQFQAIVWIAIRGSGD